MYKIPCTYETRRREALYLYLWRIAQLWISKAAVSLADCKNLVTVFFNKMSGMIFIM